MVKVYRRGFVVGMVLLGVLAASHLSAKPLFPWPLEVSFESKSPKIVDAPVSYEIVFREGRSGPVKSFTLTVRTYREMRHFGQTKWSIDFEGKDEVRIPIELMIGKNDTGGIILDLQVVHESGAITRQPSEFYFLPDTESLFRTQDHQPPQVGPRSWVIMYGSQEQKDSLRLVEFNRGQKEAAERRRQTSSSSIPDSGTVTIGPSSYRKTLEDKRFGYLYGMLNNEANPLAGKKIEKLQIGRIALARLEGESEFRFWKPFSQAESKAIYRSGKGGSYVSEALLGLDRFLENQVVYLSLSSPAAREKAESLVSELRATSIDSVFEATVTVEQFKAIIQAKIRFQKGLSDFENSKAK